MKWLKRNRPTVTFFVVAILGFLFVDNDNFESFAVLALAFILAKQFESEPNEK